ncbi:MAG: preprotein translocase subunit SecY [Clostridia bacterium]|nr:preprotein translocase subunit SecY [Clostridia bacterium]
MFRTIANAWKTADLRKKMIFTLLIVLLYRIGANIPVPFVNITEALDTSGGNILTYFSMMTGSAFNYGTLFALGVTPYINSSIIIQLLGVAIPAIGRLEKEGEEGRKKIAAITRYLTIGLAVLQSVAYYFYIKNTNSDYLAPTEGTFAAVFEAIVIVICFTAGSALVMWLGEQINDRGIGNGISIILFAGIVSRIPTLIGSLWQYFTRGGVFYALSPIVLVCFLLMIAFIVWMDNAERRLPIQYAKRVVGRKMYGGQSTHMPIKVNMSGVLPIIFASSILSIPTTVQMFVNVEEGSFWEKFFNVFSSEHWPYAIIYFVLIIFFAYFYATIQYNPVEMANNLRKNNGAIPGIRPGKSTSDYIGKIINRVTLLGALLISVVALFPILFQLGTKAGGLDMQISMGGTSLIIVVGVALETVKQLESQMMMRHYKGFLD